MRTGRKTDEGFTLIELIVVIAIIAILTGAVIVSINPIQATAAKQAATNTQDAILKGKQYAMTRGNDGTYMVISQGKKDLEATYYVNNKEIDSEVISTRKVDVKYDNGEGGTGYIKTWGDATTTVKVTDLYIGFDKGSGSCRTFTSSATEARNTKLSTSNERSIEISAGGRTYKITVSGLTGRVDMIRQ